MQVAHPSSSHVFDADPNGVLNRVAGCCPCGKASVPNVAPRTLRHFFETIERIVGKYSWRPRFATDHCAKTHGRENSFVVHQIDTSRWHPTACHPNRNYDVSRIFGKAITFHSQRKGESCYESLANQNFGGRREHKDSLISTKDHVVSRLQHDTFAVKEVRCGFVTVPVPARSQIQCICHFSPLIRTSILIAHAGMLAWNFERKFHSSRCR